MQRWLSILIVAIVVAIIGHATRWFGITRPAIDQVRNEANARIDATKSEVAANSARIAQTEQKTAALESASNEQAQRIDSLDQRAKDAAAATAAASDASRAAQADVAKLAERVDANSHAIAEIKAQVAAATPSDDERALQRDLINAMSIASQFKAAVAESIQTEGRLPAGNAQVGLSAPERYADGSLTRIAVELGVIVAYFKPAGALSNPRLRLVPNPPSSDPVGIVRWKCDTNIALAAKSFQGCELKL